MTTPGAVAVCLAFLVLISARPASAGAVKVVHVVSSTHLDVGFADTAPHIIARYVADDGFLVNATLVARQLRKLGGDAQLRFMVQPYVVAIFFQCTPLLASGACPNATTRSIVAEGLREGDLFLNAYPFNGEPEVASVELFEAALQQAADIADHFQQPAPLTMSQRDVPGMTRGVVPLLAKHGIKAVSVGVNTASLPPSVPRAFLWRDEGSATEVIAMWHPHGYGGLSVDDCVVLDGFEHALCPAWTGDNSGPPNVTEVQQNWDALQAEFPGAKVIASTFDAFVTELENDSGVRASLPVVVDEIGDTWIYGIASDPYKLAASRAMNTAYGACVRAGECPLSDSQIWNYTRLAAKAHEHTWGLDVKTWLHDAVNWSNELFQSHLGDANFLTMIASWQRQRDWALTYPRQALDDKHPLAVGIDAALAALHDLSAFNLSGYSQVADVGQSFDCGNGVALKFDSVTGDLSGLVVNDGSVTWYDATAPLAFYRYQTYNATSYADFFNDYAQRDANGKIPGYFPLDFGKPNVSLAHPNITWSKTKLVALFRSNTAPGSFIVHMEMEDSAHLTHDYGAPTQVQVSLDVNADGSGLYFELLVLNKTATRLPEAAWALFRPAMDPSSVSVSLTKLGSVIDPMRVVVNGSQHLHAVDELRISSSQQTPQLRIEPVDAALCCLGEPSAFPTPDSGPPDVSQGISFCLENVLWGTNYPMWTPAPTMSFKYRFRLSFEDGSSS